jgi:hypothetical protein
LLQRRPHWRRFPFPEDPVTAAPTGSNTQESGDNRQKRIAVVVVHGVGSPEPKHSASAVANLLLRLPRHRESKYSSFTESPIEIATSPVPEPSEAADAPVTGQARARSRFSYDERPEGETISEADDMLPPDIRFMRNQLRGYRSTADTKTYSTVRIDGGHLSGPESIEPDTDADRADARVHVYEMFWADLSRIGSSVWSVFGAFYQVVIHLPYVGLITLQEAKHKSALKTKLSAGVWDAWIGACKWAVRCMTLLAPTLNFVMLAIGVGALTRRIPATWQPYVAAIVPGLIALGLATRLIYGLRGQRGALDIIVPLLAAGTATAAGIFIPWPITAQTALIFEWWAVAFVPLFLIFRKFQENRPFALPAMIVAYAIATVWQIWIAATQGQDSIKIVLWTLEYFNTMLFGTFLIFAVATLIVTAFGVVVPRMAKLTNRDDARAVRRAAYTARFALAMPSIAFAVVTLSIWGALVASQAEGALGSQRAYEPALTYPTLPRHIAADSAKLVGRIAADSTRLVQQHLLSAAAHERARVDSLVQALHGPSYFLRTFGGSTDGLPGAIGAGVLGLAVVMLIWVLLPVLVTELRSPGTSDENRMKPGFQDQAKNLGTWLSTAFRTARISGEMLVFLTIFSIAGITIASPSELLGPRQWLAAALELPTPDFSYVRVGALIVGVGAIGLIALTSRLTDVGKRLRPAFGIMADVDNYLRELPTDRTPRARMAERFTSLLRYLCLWRAESSDTNSGYDAIIIVAHSQGTVLSADLLRYLKYIGAGTRGFEPRLSRLRAGADGKPKLPIYLMTMGCPLRQLYAQRFPNIYGWVTDGAAANDLMGVAGWINLYRSGDYVGRAVWQAKDASPDLYDPNVRWSHGNIAEACIGPGAHTHYWDVTSDVVAETIDEVVKGILAGSTSVEIVERAIETATNPPRVRAGEFSPSVSASASDPSLRSPG